MEVRASRAARGADVSDDLKRHHVIAELEARLESRQVRVSRFDPARMLDHHQIAARAAVGDEVDDAGAGGADGSAHRGAEVRALVRHDLVEDRVHALRVEARRDGSAFDGLAPAALVHGASFRVVVAVRLGPAEVVDAQRLVVAVRGHDLQRLDARVALEVAEHGDLLGHDAQTISAMEVCHRRVSGNGLVDDGCEPRLESTGLHRSAEGVAIESNGALDARALDGEVELRRL